MKPLHKFFTIIFISGLLTGCSTSDDDIMTVEPTGESKIYQLNSVADPSISGTATFIENDDRSVTIDLSIEGTPQDGLHPAHIHLNSAAEGGDIALTLGTVEGSTGESSITVNALDNGTAITYEELLEFDGYINVHLSESQLDIIVAQGDIGENELTGETKTYDLNEVAVEGISGTATFEQRVNGDALATLQLENTPDGGMHPAHIHANTAVEGGAIIFSFNPVDGTSGMSKTNVETLDDGTAFGYEQVLNVNGYINVHLSAEDLGTLVAQGDIGQNELTGESKIYDLNEVAVEGISGTATFEERVNGDALATLQLENTPDGGMHPAHIHANTAVEGGAIIFSFNPVNGTSGMSKTNVAALDDESAFGYADVLEVDGYINVHFSAEDLGTLVAQGDIGQNELTGQSITYQLDEKDVPGISGTATFEERINGEALATLQLENTPDGGIHPSHIHENTAAEGGDIIFTFNPVDGTSGMSKTNVATLDDETAFGYAEVLVVDGYINIHFSAEALDIIVAQGNIGENAP